jgi:hypothetical protein
MTIASFGSLVTPQLIDEVPGFGESHAATALE